MRRRLSLLAFLTACAAPSDLPTESAAGQRLVEEWRSEVIQLPPEFAPGLPKGKEELRFAPGMFDASADDYWSYAFVLRLESTIAGKEKVQEILDRYYKGLIRAVAKGKFELDREPARASLEKLHTGRYRASIDLVDAFVTRKPLQVRMELWLTAGPSGTDVLAAASPKPYDDAIWQSLRAVLGSLR